MKIKSIVWTVLIALALLATAFFLGRFSATKGISESTKLDEDLKILNEKVSELEKRNEELITLNEEQERLCSQLKSENKSMKKTIGNINELTISTRDKLDEMENSATSIFDTLTLIKENQKVLKAYILSVSKEISQ